MRDTHERVSWLQDYGDDWVITRHKMMPDHDAAVWWRDQLLALGVNSWLGK
jgi:hypothetical protein